MQSRLLNICRSQWVFTRLLCLEFKLEGCGLFNTSQQKSFLNQGSKLFPDNFNHHVQAGLLRSADGKGEAAQPPSSSPPRLYHVCLCRGTLLVLKLDTPSLLPHLFPPSLHSLHLRIPRPFLTIKLLILMTILLDNTKMRALGSTAHNGTCYSPSPSLLIATAAHHYCTTTSPLLLPALCGAPAPV